jgi:hypothetical protein
VTEKRLVEVLKNDGKWYEVSMNDLEPGDRFRMYYPNRIMVTKSYEASEWEVTEDPIVIDEESQLYGVKCIPMDLFECELDNEAKVDELTGTYHDPSN